MPSTSALVLRERVPSPLGVLLPIARVSSSLSAIDLRAADADGGEGETAKGVDSSGGRVTAMGVDRGGNGGGPGRDDGEVGNAGDGYAGVGVSTGGACCNAVSSSFEDSNP